MLNSVAKIILAGRFDAFAELHEQFLQDKAPVID
jgi:hypothetical protein